MLLSEWEKTITPILIREGNTLINKLLIANRGEIAVRIARACGEMGIRSLESGVRSVAIYTDADRHGLHVKKADEAYSVGTDPVAGYLNAHRIVNLAVETGCTAIHPGYGFLSENPLPSGVYVSSAQAPRSCAEWVTRPKPAAP